MKRLTATTVLCLLLFSAAFVTGKGPSAAPEYPDSLRSVWLYTEGVKQNAIAGDSVRARELFLEAIRNDSTYAPAYYELAANGMYATPDEAVELARKAFRLDTTNKWYHQFYGQALIYAGRYDEALKVYRRLQTENPKDPDNYRILAALYEQKQSPVMALVTLDSAELRFGRIPVLSAMKRRLLVATNQIDKAVVEARAMVEAAPYEAQREKLQRDARNAKASIRSMSQKEKTALQRKIAQEQQLDVAIGELRKLTKGNTEGASFSAKTSGLRLPVTAGRVKRYKENMAEITGPKGAHVISIYDGKVVDVKRNRITNKYDVYVAHGEYITSYANMGTICVEKGQKVARNAQIGTIGSAVNVMTMETEYKLVFGIYPPNPGQKMRAEECFRK